MSKPRRRPLAGFLLAVASLAIPGCRIMPDGAYWIEALGRARGVRIAAWPAGALAIGTDAGLYSYPGGWGRPWAYQGPQHLKALAASHTAVHAIWPDGHVARFAAGRWTPIPGSPAWKAEDIAASAADRVLLVVGGRLQVLDGLQPRDAPCASLTNVAAAAGRGDEVFVVDRDGGLHRGVAAGCVRIDAPARLQRIAVTTGRMVAVAADGSVWRRRDGAGWTALPTPRKYRAGRPPFETRAADVAISAYNTWLMDHEGSIFVLSDET